MTIESLPPCVPLYASEPRAMLVGLIQGLEEELATMARHKWNAEKRSSREIGLSQYRRALARFDASAAAKPSVVN